MAVVFCILALQVMVGALLSAGVQFNVALFELNA